MKEITETAATGTEKSICSSHLYTYTGSQQWNPIWKQSYIDNLKGTKTHISSYFYCKVLII